MPLRWEKLETENVQKGEEMRTILGMLQGMLQTNVVPVVQRAKVPGGWLVSVIGAGITFYPDPNHLWDGNSLS